MSKNNQCECYPEVWLEWENQMEPGYTCQKCREEEYEATNHIEEEKLSPLMQKLILEKELEYAKPEAIIKTIDGEELPF